MYYLQSRYYNPEWGRFINADGIAGQVGVLLSHNVFVYCSNNPISLKDDTGFLACSAVEGVSDGGTSDRNVGDKPVGGSISSGNLAQRLKAFTGTLKTKFLNNGVSEPKETLYHYTNEKGMNGIVESKQLNPSLKANNPKDARYGNGQYLSDITPDSKTPSQLAKQFINVPNKYKYTNYIEIDVRGLNLTKGRDGVFVLPNESPLDLTGRLLDYGRVGVK